MNTRVEPSRLVLAILTVFALFLAMMMVLTAPADANHVSTVAHSEEANGETFWENFLNNHDGITGAECTKVDESSESSNLVSDGNYRLVIVKQGSGELANKLHWDVSSGDVLPPAQNAPGYSHYLTCTVPVTTTAPPTTAPPTTEAPTTAPPTTEAPTTTTSTIADEVLGTTITTAPPTTASVDPVSTTVPDEVLGTHIEADELPFTGLQSELIVGMAVLLLMSGLLVLGLVGEQGRHEES